MVMEISFAQVEIIFNSIPIGYYLGRRIEIELDDNMSPVAYFNPVTDKIVISYGIIMMAMRSIERPLSSNEIEVIVRSLVYHEVSHVILTPTYQELLDYQYSYDNKYEIVNVFEDERIETIMRHFYLNTDFRRTVVLVNNFHGEEPTDAFSAFYQLVRYHKTFDKRWLKRVAKIINNYSFLTGVKNACATYQITNYLDEIFDLYKDYTKSWEKEQENKANAQNSKSDNNSSDNSSDNSNNTSNDIDTTEETSNPSTDTNDTEDDIDEDDDTDGTSSAEKSINNSQDNNDTDTTDTTDNMDDNTDTTNITDDNNTDDVTDNTTESGDNVDSSSSNKTTDSGDNNIDTTEEEIDDLDDILNSIDDIEITNPVDIDTLKNYINEIFNIYKDDKIAHDLQILINEKLKQNKRNGSAINSYSGRFNVRSVSRDDYKWWTTQNREGHIKQCSKIHFNLFIDNSGSFRNNDDRMNTFIRALDTINLADFTFDVITINTNIVEWENTKQLFRSYGGTYMGAEIKDIIKKHKKSNCNTYNIVVFDGECDVDYVGNGKNSFSYFDTPNSIIITDTDNRYRIEENNMKFCKVNYINYDYCNKFIEEIIALLHKVA